MSLIRQEAYCTLQKNMAYFWEMSWSVSTANKDWCQKFTINRWQKFEPRYFCKFNFNYPAFSGMNFTEPITDDCGSSLIVLFICSLSESMKTGKVCNKLRFCFWNFSNTYLLGSCSNKRQLTFWNKHLSWTKCVCNLPFNYIDKIL